MSASNLQELGRTIRLSRTRLGLSVRDVGEKTGVHAATVSRLETGQIDGPRPEHLINIARVLDLEIEDLYALAGYLAPQGLPELSPYLRAKYELPDQAIKQLDEYFQALRTQWAHKEDDHDRGDNHT